MATASLALWEADGRGDRRERRLPPHRARSTLQRRGRDRRLGPLARLRPHRRARHPHALGARRRPSAAARPASLEGRRLLPHRRHRRPRARRPGDRRRRDAPRRQRASVLRRPRPRARGRPRSPASSPRRGSSAQAPWCSPAGPGPPPSAASSASAFRRRAVRSSILAVGPGAEGPDASPHLAGLADPAPGRRLHPRRQRHGAGRSDAAAASASRAPFLPMFARRWRCSPRSGSQAWREGPEPSAAGASTRSTPFEKIRVLDPVPRPGTVATPSPGRGSSFPASACPGHRRMGGYVDCTPDGVPVIGVNGLPGLILAAGFSGHGFGIGPGAGHLIADLVTGATRSSTRRPTARPGSTAALGARFRTSERFPGRGDAA